MNCAWSCLIIQLLYPTFPKHNTWLTIAWLENNWIHSNSLGLNHYCYDGHCEIQVSFYSKQIIAILSVIGIHSNQVSCSMQQYLSQQGHIIPIQRAAWDCDSWKISQQWISQSFLCNKTCSLIVHYNWQLNSCLCIYAWGYVKCQIFTKNYIYSR